MKTFLALVIALVPALLNPADVNLQYKFKVGDKFEYTQSSKQTTKQSIPGMGDVTIDALIGGGMLFEIKEVNAQGARIEAQYNKLSISMNSTMVNMNMDSDGSPDDPQNKAMKAVTGKTFIFVLTPQGTVDKVEGVDNLFSGFNELGLDETTLNNTKRALQQNLNDQSLRATLETGLLQYPGKKIKTGDTWTSTTNQTISFPLKIDNTWNLASVDGAVASVKSDGVVTTVDKDKITHLPNGLKSKADLSGRQAIAARVDVSTGWPSEVKLLSELKGNLTLLAGGMIPEDMDIPMEIVTETTYTITRK